ncbi:MAG: hypothetical protein GQ557_01805, partial [Mycoplasmataceae bacterium]|nr:hypothetical protein [Mycoplasmataceae bacterium]
MNKNKKTIIQTSKKIFMQISLGSFLCVIVILILFNPFYSSWNSVNNYSSSTSNNVVAVENTPKEAIPP